FSTYATYIIDKKFEVFARYDQLASNTLVSETDPWNLSKNGSAIITGIQYKVVKGVRMAVNYQGWKPKDSTKDSNSLMYLSFEYSF
ncbi:MAG: porin, partial [Bacteroidetes bacterium]|nr:porin [Bacteroidota bacterium]